MLFFFSSGQTYHVFGSGEVKCSDKVEFWEEICRLPLKYVSAAAKAAAFYAKYPAELADEMAVDFIQYVDCSKPPNADEDMHPSMLSSLVSSDTYFGLKINASGSAFRN